METGLLTGTSFAQLVPALLCFALGEAASMTPVFDDLVDTVAIDVSLAPGGGRALVGSSNFGGSVLGCIEARFCS